MTMSLKLYFQKFNISNLREMLNLTLKLNLK